MTDRDDAADEDDGHSDDTQGAAAEPEHEETGSEQTEKRPSPLPRAEEHQQPRHRRRRLGPFLVGFRTLLALLSAAALLATGTAWYGVSWVSGSANTTEVLNHLRSRQNAPPADDGANDILLVGTDSRTDAQGHPLPKWRLEQLRTTADNGINTDTIILLRVPKDGGRAYAVSIPRDSYVRVPDLGKNKINSAFGLTKAAARKKLLAEGETDDATVRRKATAAGRAALAGAVENVTGVSVDHYAEVNLFGFYLLSKAIGGVEVCLRAPTHDKDSGANFPAGAQTISGSDALSFVRQRKHIPGGDIGRIQRQQVFLASAAKKLLSAGTLTDPDRLAALADTARKALTMDPDLNMIDLLRQAQALASGDVTFVTIPVVTITGKSPDGQSIVEVDPKRVRTFVKDLIADDGAAQPAEPTVTTPVQPSSYTVRGSSPTGDATDEPSRPVTIDGHRCVY